jgi:hypothetical protein
MSIKTKIVEIFRIYYPPLVPDASLSEKQKLFTEHLAAFVESNYLKRKEPKNVKLPAKHTRKRK